MPVHIIGCGGHAKVIAAMIEAGAEYSIGGFVDRDATGSGTFLGYPIVAETAFLDAPEKGPVVIALGEGVRRREAFSRFEKAGFSTFPSVVAPSANIGPDVSIGQGTVVMPGVCINTGSRVGAFCVLNTGSILEHDCSLGDFAALAPGATVGGNCYIGEMAYVGIGAAVSHGVRIGEQAVLGGGSFLRDDTGLAELWGGVPAKRIRSRKPDQPVL